MAIDELLKDPAFQNIEPDRIELVKQMYTELQGKTQMEQMAVLMAYNKRISAGKKISKEEQQLMIDVLLRGLPEKDQGNFKNILKMLRLYSE